MPINTSSPLAHQHGPSVRWRAGRETLRLSDWPRPAGPRWATRDVKGFRMKTRVANPTEQRCPACDGTGVVAAIQPVQPGRRIYPPPCGE
jgi:hypothetical protein